jgi:hypothetical protein
VSSFLTQGKDSASRAQNKRIYSFFVEISLIFAVGSDKQLTFGTIVAAEIK